MKGKNTIWLSFRWSCTKDIEAANNEQIHTENIFNLGSQANARVLYCVYVRNLERRQQNVR